jgi:Rubisco LSMT substrate-binding
LSEEFPVRLILKEYHNGEQSSISDSWRKWLLSVLETRLSDYQTSLEDDRELLRQSKEQSPSNETHRKAMAIEIRIGEKEILTQAITKLKTLVKESLEAEPPKKKLRT